MMKTKWLLMLGLAASAAVADVRLNALFSDGMVIQRNIIAPLWGWADPGEKVSVTTSWGATLGAVKSNTSAPAPSPNARLPLLSTRSTVIA